MLIHVVHILQLITYLSLENYENILAPKAECQHDVDVHLCMSTYPFYCPHSVYVLPVLFLTFNKQGKFLHISNTYRNVIWSLLWVQIFSWFGICLYTLILIFVLFSIHVCVFFSFFSWSNNLYLKGNKNLSWFGNFTSGKNYSTILTSKLLELNGKKHKYKTDTATKFQYTPLTQVSATSWRHTQSVQHAFENGQFSNMWAEF